MKFKLHEQDPYFDPPVRKIEVKQYGIAKFVYVTRIKDSH